MSNNTSPQPQHAGLPGQGKPAAAAAAAPKAKNITLFVGNLSTEVDEPYLRRLFAAYSEVKRVCVYRQPELHALIEVTSYDDADTAIAALHCRYCMAPNVPVLVFYHKSNPVVTAYGKSVWDAYVEANSHAGGMDALYRNALDSKGLGDVKQDGSTCPPPGAPLMVLPRPVVLEGYDSNLPRRKPPVIPPDIIQLGKMYLQNEAMASGGGGNAQRGGGGDNGGRGSGGGRGRSRFTHQFTTSLIPGVDAPSSGLNRHRGAGRGGGGAPYQGGGRGGGMRGMRGGMPGGGYQGRGGGGGGMDHMYQPHHGHHNMHHQQQHHQGPPPPPAHGGMYGQQIPPQYHNQQHQEYQPHHHAAPPMHHHGHHHHNAYAQQYGGYPQHNMYQ